MNTDNLKKRFAEAGLELEIAKAPLSGGASIRRRGATAPVVEVIQLDIKRRFKGNARSEYFVLWPGNESNIVMVQGVDKEYAQLVLCLQEPEREFVETANSWVVREYNSSGKATFCRNHGLQERNVWVDKGELKIKRRTPKGVRHFLAGRDERQLFMCQLPQPCTTVAQAHACLKTSEVYLAEGKAGRADRQGEWFFLPLTNDEKRELDTYLKSSLAKIHKNTSIGNQVGRAGGKPHIAEEAVSLGREPELEHGFPVRSRARVFVRGRISHPDHKSLKFSTWRKVLGNAESRGSVAIGGGTWID